MGTQPDAGIDRPPIAIEEGPAFRRCKTDGFHRSHADMQHGRRSL